MTTPTPQTIVGKPPVPPTVVGDAAAGKILFASTCGACHTFTPAGTTGKVGPDLDHLAAYAKAANQGGLLDFTKTSIVDPGAYVEHGFPNGVMPGNYGQTLSAKQIADLVAFLAKGP